MSTFTCVVAMVLQTRSPSVRAALRSDQKLHCQFAVDHKGPNVSVSWRLRRRGEYTPLFSHASRSGQTQGSGVRVKVLAGGDVSLSLLPIKMTSEGIYICSVSVPPLTTSQDITLHIIGECRLWRRYTRSLDYQVWTKKSKQSIFLDNKGRSSTTMGPVLRTEF